MGDLDGMYDLESRLDREKNHAQELPGVPRWDGRPIAGTLLVNQLVDGFGDAIMGIRSAPAARARCGRLGVLCAAPIAGIARAGRGRGRGLHSPRGPARRSRPRRRHSRCPGGPASWTAATAIPAGRPYLSVPRDLVRRWEARLSSIEGYRIGVVWQGDPLNGNDVRRSFPLAALAPLAAVPGVSLVSLQRGFGTDQIADAGVPLVDLMDLRKYVAGDLCDTAAVMQCLDLVVAADTGLAHLAGALGLPVWLAIPRVPEWRWQLDREDSPWYPTARLFRQTTEGDWAGVFRRMAALLSSQTGPQ